jgi:hypothetical protein
MRQDAKFMFNADIETVHWLICLADGRQTRGSILPKAEHRLANMIGPHVHCRVQYSI